jgi:Proteasome subunit
MREFCGKNADICLSRCRLQLVFIFSRYLRQECINHKYSYGRNYPVGRLINLLGLKMQVCTQRYDRRPYGVGLLVAGYDVSSKSISYLSLSDHKIHFRIKDHTSTKHVQAPTSTTARRWPSVLVLKAPEHTWKST